MLLSYSYHNGTWFSDNGNIIEVSPIDGVDPIKACDDKHVLDYFKWNMISLEHYSLSDMKILSDSIFECSDPPSLHDCLVILYNIALGQRKTTPKFSSKFIDRYDKTFFDGKTKISATVSQHDVTMMSALSNYVMMTSYDEQTGCVSNIFREFLVLIGNIAESIAYRVSSSDPLGGSRTRIPKRSGISSIIDLNVTTDDVEMIRSFGKDVERTACEIAIGCCMMGCWMDHSVTKKDLSSATVRRVMSGYAGIAKNVRFVQADNEHKEDPDVTHFADHDDLNMLILMARSVNIVSIIPDDTDKIITLKADEK